MIQLFKTKQEQDNFENTIDCHKNPFQSDKIESVKIEISKDLFNDNIEFKSTVYFKNENTSGYQYLYGIDFNDIVVKTKNFIDSM